MIQVFNHFLACSNFFSLNVLNQISRHNDWLEDFAVKIYFAFKDVLIELLMVLSARNLSITCTK